MPDKDRERHETSGLQITALLILAAGFLAFCGAVTLTAALGGDDSEGFYYSAPAEIMEDSSKSVTTKVTSAKVTTAKTKKAKTTVSKVMVESAAEVPAAVVYDYPMDINLADMDAFLGVNGVGEVTASAVIAYREQVGVIHRMEQLTEISGIGEKTLELLCQYFYVSDEDHLPDEPDEPQPEEQTVTEQPCVETEQPDESQPDEPQMRDVNINTAAAEEIAEALLLTDEQAQAIVSLREQLIYFSSPEELLYTKVINADVLRRIRAHLLF